jgi:hypothetical protein
MIWELKDAIQFLNGAGVLQPICPILAQGI